MRRVNEYAGSGRLGSGGVVWLARVAGWAGLATLLVPGSATGAGVWLRGDLHMHSTYSDGDSPVADVVQRGEDQGLDFLALTDHDTSLGGNPAHWTDPDYRSDTLILLYGIEWTTGKGHANVWAAQPYDYAPLWEANRAEDVDTAIRLAHDQGAVFSINHPAAYACCPWEYENTEPADSVEVWNGTYRVPCFNGQATHDFYDGRLSNGRTPAAVGGSDTHYLSFPQAPFWTIGNPTTWVYASARTAEAVLDAIRAGHTSVSYGPTAPRLELWADGDGDGATETMMGDAVPSGRRVDFLVRLVDPDGSAPARQARPARTVPRSMLDAMFAGKVSPLDVYRATAGQREESCRGHLLVMVRDGRPFHAATLPCGTESYGFHDKPEPGSYYRVEAIGFPDDLNPIQRPLYGETTAISSPIYAE